MTDRRADSPPASPGPTADAAQQVAEPATSGTTSAPQGGRRVQWSLWAQRYGALAALVVLFVYNAVAPRTS